ncbi:MAG: 50S ribosomal protein L16 [Candidatus Veblenbacteria bacterium]|nr:50S ribosomal protein L16 [Candidatus Veblenbacteria bacterium]MDZ4229628.1 50S ribosomal protein L16 [Candidatus Veblenbacteria bacterium]
MLIPKKVKYRKSHRGDQIRGKASRKITLSFGDFGLRSLEAGWITSRQLEAARRAITGNLQRKGKLWIRVFPDKSVTVKGNEIRMGGGKGAVDHYVAPIRPGTILFEVDGVTLEQATVALKLAAYKLPVKTVIAKKSVG